LFLAPTPLLNVNRPSPSVTTAVPAMHRLPDVSVPSINRTPYASMRNTLS
jgi:hypothetical protein